MNKAQAPLTPHDQSRPGSRGDREARPQQVRRVRTWGGGGVILADPTDVGRRVARRRTQLGITRAELAERAGMPVEFIEYVETRPTADPGISTLWRLAAALETGPYILLGGGRSRPPGWTGAVGQPRLRELVPQECWDLLVPGGVGRVAAMTDDGLVVLPMIFTVDGRSVLIRTSAQGVLTGLGEGTEIAFQVDRVDEDVREGWSVLLVGGIQRVDEEPSSGKVEGPQPWVGGSDLLLRVRPRRITGRRIEAA